MKNRKTWLILGAASIILGPALFIWTYEQETNRREAVALAKLKSLGYATTLEEIQRQAPSDGDNAAPIIEELANLFEKRQSGTIDLDWGISAKKEDYFARNAALFAEFDRISDRKTLWFESSLRSPDNLRIHIFLRAIGRAYVDRAMIHVTRGRTDEALADLRRTSAIENLLRTEGSMNSVVLGQALRELRERAVIEMMVAEKSLAGRQRVAAALEPEKLFDSKKLVGSQVRFVTTRWDTQTIYVDRHGHTHPFDPPLYQLPAIRNRARAFALESLALQAEIATDGLLTKSETNHASREDYVRAKGERFAQRICETLTPSLYGRFTSEEFTTRSNLSKSMVDHLIEAAGGPKASSHPGVIVENSTGRIAFSVPHALVRHVLENGGYRLERTR